MLYRHRNGEKFGWGRVLDYIGIKWEDIPDEDQIQDEDQIPGQMRIEDFEIN